MTGGTRTQSALSSEEGVLGSGRFVGFADMGQRLVDEKLVCGRPLGHCTDLCLCCSEKPAILQLPGDPDAPPLWGRVGMGGSCTSSRARCAIEFRSTRSWY